MGSQCSSSRHQALSDANQSGIPGFTTLLPDSQLRIMTPISRPVEASVCHRESPPVNPKTPQEIDEKELVPCVFTWNQGGHSVYLTGSFSNWTTSSGSKLVRSGHEFLVIKDLPRGIHHYKFIVDDQWRYAPDQQTTTDDKGNINNLLDISKYKQYDFLILSDYEHARHAHYHQNIPNPADLSSDASSLPILLSKSLCMADHQASPDGIPLHCVANHLYHDSYAAGIFGPQVIAVAATIRLHPEENVTPNIPQRHATYTYVTMNPLMPPLGSSQLPEFVPPNFLTNVLKSSVRIGNL